MYTETVSFEYAQECIEKNFNTCKNFTYTGFDFYEAGAWGFGDVHYQIQCSDATRYREYLQSKNLI